MLCYITDDMLCYITVMLCMLDYKTHVRLCNIIHDYVMLYNT